MKPTITHHVTMHFPIIDTKATEREQYDKVIEEYNEFRKEMFSEASPERLLHELQDVFQAYSNYLFQKVKPFCVDELEAAEKVIQLLDEANTEHRRKIERYRKERGWT
jgi:Ribonuclease G/E